MYMFVKSSTETMVGSRWCGVGDARDDVHSKMQLM